MGIKLYKMLKFNKGIIYTNKNCQGCNKCVNTCVSLGANVSNIRNHFSRVEVSEKCISCGVCLDHCPHNARSYTDDVESFFDSLKSGEKISLIVSPAFYIVYPDSAPQILGYLKSLGVNTIYDSGVGSEISMWLHARFLHNNLKENIHSEKFLSNTCHSFLNLCETLHPELLDNIIPIHTPEMCTAIYAKKYIKDDSKLAFLGPCITAKQTFIDNADVANVEFNLTFLHLIKYLKGMDLSSYNAQADYNTVALGNLFPLPGGLIEALYHFIPHHYLLTHYESINENTNFIIKHAANLVKNKTNPILTSISGCNYGCFSGPGSERNKIDLNQIYGGIKKLENNYSKQIKFYNDCEKNFNRLDARFKEFNPDDFTCTFINKYKPETTIPASVKNEIFELLHKNTSEKRHVDCAYCGYSSCAKFVDAVAKGYTRIGNCIRYMNDEMQYQISHDSLTGLLNNYSFNIELEKMRKANPNSEFAIISADIDKLQLINSLYNFSVGDTTIKVVASTLSDFVGNAGICARFSAGLFMMAFPNDFTHLERLYDLDACDLTEFGVNYPVSLRFGIYILDPKEKNISQATNNACLAMNNITDRVHNAFAMFNRRLYNEVFLESSITSQLKEAVEKDEFHIYFQPQYSHNTKSLVGAETLSRWIKKDGEILSPSSFIPIFEKNGFILDFDHIIWEKTFATVRKWLKLGIDLVPISVNISRVSMDNDETISYINNLQKKYNVPHKYIHLEITESAVMNDQEKLINRISRLKALGFQIAMDDFGSGYSSLNTLKDFPIDILKLDMGFLRGKENMNRGGSIVSSVLRMANMLELSTIAEGVETPEQASFLTSLGCDTIQGYLYSKPIPENDFELLLLSHSKAEVPPPQKLKGLININNFFNSDSIETAFFESFAGPACIAESMHGHLSLIRINDKLLTMLGYKQNQMDFFKARFYSHLSSKDAHHIRDCINQAANTDEEITSVIEFHKNKNSPSIWIKTHIKRVTQTGEQTIFYILADDVTSLKNNK